MDNDFVNRKDRIIASAIEVISESGLSSLTTKTLAMKGNMTEELLYRYFGSIDEVLVEVVNTFTKFDDVMIATIEAKELSHFDKVLELLSTLCTYYENYYEIAAIVLNYEELLHNVNTREAIASCIYTRTSFVRNKLELAMAEGEIIDKFTPEELANLFMGGMVRDLLNRRIVYDRTPHSKVGRGIMNKLASMIRIEPED